MGLLPRPTANITPCPPFIRRPYIPPNPNNRPISLKGLFAGSGLDAMSNPYICNAVVALTRRPPSELSLLYIGTASYDLPSYRVTQTNTFAQLGVSVQSLDVANECGVPQSEMEELVNNADIILVSGGNTLYAVDRWRYLGLDELLRRAAFDGKVMTGGSAGAICWFDGGHSDSADPSSYRLAKLNSANNASTFLADEASNERDSVSSGSSCSSTLNSKQEDWDWEYVRVEGLGIWPGLICPHYNCTQSNGVLRMTDFHSMMKRHPYELGIGIDHHAALEVSGDDFRILSIPGELGSVPLQEERDDADGNNGNNNIPGAWIKYVDDDRSIHSKICPRSGKVSELLQMIEDPQKHLLLDHERVDLCRKENPLVRD